MIRTAAFLAWLDTLTDLTVAGRPVPPVPDAPDRLVMVTRTPGLPEVNDGLFERPGFQIQIRGRAGDPASAEDDAARLDDAIRNADLPALIGDAWVLSVVRRGGLAPVGPDNGERDRWAGLWIVTASTDP